MPNDQKAIVVAVRCADMDNPVAQDQCQVRKCAGCGEAVWASPSTVNLEPKYPNLKFMCQVCMPPQDAVKRGGRIGILPGSRAELEREIGTWQTTLFLHKMGAEEIDDRQ